MLPFPRGYHGSDIESWAKLLYARDATSLRIAVLSSLEVYIFGRTGNKIDSGLFEKLHHAERIAVIRRAEGAGMTGGRLCTDPLHQDECIEQL